MLIFKTKYAENNEDKRIMIHTFHNEKLSVWHILTPNDAWLVFLHVANLNFTDLYNVWLYNVTNVHKQKANDFHVYSQNW